MHSAILSPISAIFAFEKCYIFKIATSAYWSYKYCNLGRQIMQCDFYILKEDCRQVFHSTPHVDCVRFPEETIFCKWDEAF